MGSLRDWTWILGLPDYRVVALERGDNERLVIEVERRGIRRYVCSGCGRRTGRIRDAKVRTWDDVPWGTARRAERAFLEAWDRTRPTHRPRHLGVDEIQRGKGQHFWTVLSDVVRGEVIGLQRDRSEDSLRTLLAERLDARQRAAVQAVCMDMHRNSQPHGPFRPDHVFLHVAADNRAAPLCDDPLVRSLRRPANLKPRVRRQRSNGGTLRRRSWIRSI